MFSIPLMLWLWKRDVAQTFLEDYRGRNVEAEMQEIQQFLDEACLQQIDK